MDKAQELHDSGHIGHVHVRNLDENRVRRLAGFDEHVPMAEELLCPGVFLAHRDLRGARAIDFEDEPVSKL